MASSGYFGIGLAQGVKEGIAEAQANKEHLQDRDYQAKTRQLGLDNATHAAERQKVTEGQQDTSWMQNQSMVAQKMKEEGVDRFLNSIEAGADPKAAAHELNSFGDLGMQPESIQYDKPSGSLSFISRNGQPIKTTVQQLRAIVGTPKEKAVKLGPQDKLVGETSGRSIAENTNSPDAKPFQQDPTNNVWTKDAAGHWKIAAHGVAKPDGGQKTSPFNELTYQKQIEDSINLNYGKKDMLGVWSIDPDLQEKRSFAASLGAQLGREFQGKAAPGEIAEIVNASVHQVPDMATARSLAAADTNKTDKKSIDARARKIVNDAKDQAASALQERLNALRSRIEMGNPPPGVDTPAQADPNAPPDAAPDPNGPSAPTVATQADYDGVPRGAFYIDPQGYTRRKQ